jgi:hypothetical protein
MGIEEQNQDVKKPFKNVPWEQKQKLYSQTNL